jgi:hypothetical protein
LLRFLGIILRFIRLKVSVYNVYTQGGWGDPKEIQSKIQKEPKMLEILKNIIIIIWLTNYQDLINRDMMRIGYLWVFFMF